MRSFGRLAIAFAVVLAAGAAPAQVVGPIQFTEPEFPFGTTVNGLSVSTLNGVPILPLTFAFTFGGSPSVDCTVSGGPGSTTYVSDPSIEGAPGTLTITFGGDANDFRFGFAVLPSSGGEEPPLVEGRPAARAWSRPLRTRALGSKGVSALAVPGAVQLRAYAAGGALVGTAVVDAIDNPGDDFPGNLASVTTAAPFRRVEIEWNDEALSAFALDNLAVRRAPAETVVPSLSGVGLAALALAIVAAGAALLRLRG